MFDIGVILCDPTPVAAHTAAMRVKSRTGFRRHGAPVSGALFYGRVALGQLRLRQFREVRWSLNPASPDHQIKSCGSGSFERTSTVNSTTTPKNQAATPLSRAAKITQLDHYILSRQTMPMLRRKLEAIQDCAGQLNVAKIEADEPLGVSEIIHLLASAALDDLAHHSARVRGPAK